MPDLSAAGVRGRAGYREGSGVNRMFDFFFKRPYLLYSLIAVFFVMGVSESQLRQPGRHVRGDRGI